MTPKTCSRESGAKLQALGVRVSSYFVRVTDKDLKINVVATREYALREDSLWLGAVMTPAYLSGELLAMLPYGEMIEKRGHDKESEHWDADSSDGRYAMPFMTGSLEDTLCMRLEWLITEGHVTVEEINNAKP